MHITALLLIIPIVALHVQPCRADIISFSPDGNNVELPSGQQIQIPTTIPFYRPERDGEVFLNLDTEESSSESQVLYFSWDSSCLGQTACGIATFYRVKLTNPYKHLLSKILSSSVLVDITPTIQGAFIYGTCNIVCTDNILFWINGGYLFAISARGGSDANSARGELTNSARSVYLGD